MHQPNSDDAHDYTYPQQAEGLRQFDPTPWPARAERRMAALEANAAEQARLIEELRRLCTDLAGRVAVLEAEIPALRQRVRVLEVMEVTL